MKTDIKKQVVLENQFNQKEITCDVNLIKNQLEIEFNLNKFEYSSSIFDLKNSFKNWGLWNFDVCEVFLQFNDEVKYYEYQVSPLNQQFSLEIFSPRKISFTPFYPDFSSKVLNKKVSFYFSRDFSKVKNFKIGLFACINIEGKTQYFSHYPHDGIIDFHRPEKFLSIY